MVRTALEITYLLLPAIAANIAPVITAYYNILPHLNRPLDGGYYLRGRRILGSHKTVRGLIIGIIFGLLTGLIQYLLSQDIRLSALYLIPYQNLPVSLFAAGTLAYAALMGDALKSFIKRQFDIKPGSSWIPFDQIDFVIAALIAASLFANLTWMHVILAIIFIGFGSFVASYVGKIIHLKKNI